MRRTTAGSFVPLVAFALLALADAREARACGGCFAPPDQITQVTDHRMVIALSNQQTTLWDQIRYGGSPNDFVWVLPTPMPAQVQTSTVEFFDWLETQTRPQVIAPPRSFSTNSGPSFGCGSASAPLAAATGGADDVTVYHTGQVGPYDTATIGSASPDALVKWLNDHGYAVPPAMKPTIGWYVTLKWVFNAVRLRPGASVNQMTPLRVTYPGLQDTFPLRMVAAGASSSLGILLWVIADQRYAAMNYDTVTIDEGQLVWSSVDNKSNYRQLFTQTIAAHNGRAFITEYAQPFSANSYSKPNNSDGDLAAAMTGQAGTSTLTRLRTSLAPALLTTDLQLAPSPSNAPVSNLHRLTGAQLVSSPIGAGLGGAGLPMALAALCLMLALGRRRLARPAAR